MTKQTWYELTSLSHYRAYIELAENHNYTVEIVVVGRFTKEDCVTYHSQCIHKVPLHTIQRMASQFEP